MNVEAKQQLLEQMKAELATQPTRQSKLVDYDDLIDAMRGQGAPWKMIARYLGEAGVQVSHEAVRSYWHRHHHRPRKPDTPARKPSRESQKQQWTFNPPSKLE